MIRVCGKINSPPSPLPIPNPTPKPTLTPTPNPTPAPTTAKLTPRDILVPGHECPVGTEPITESWQACDAVAHVDYMATSVFSAWDGKRPQGCFRSQGNNRFHFNMGRGGASLDGDRILCRPLPPAVLVPGHECPVGTAPIIDSWQACEAAAKALGFSGDSVAHVAYMATEVFSAWDGKRPEGCFRSTGNRRFHFNVGRGGASLEGDSILCQPEPEPENWPNKPENELENDDATPSRNVLVSGHVCPVGTEPLTTSWEACKFAAVALGFSGDAVAHVDYMATSVFSAWDGKRPRGCFRSTGNNRFHFNMGRGGASLEGDSILCTRVLPKLVAGHKCVAGTSPVVDSWQACKAT